MLLKHRDGKKITNKQQKIKAQDEYKMYKVERKQRTDENVQSFNGRTYNTHKICLYFRTQTRFQMVISQSFY